MPGTHRRCTLPAGSGTGGGTHIHTGFCCGWRDDEPVAHHTNIAPKENHQFSRRIPVNAAKRTDRKKRQEEYIPSGSTCNRGAGSRAQRFGVQWRRDHWTSNTMDPIETLGWARRNMSDKKSIEWSIRLQISNATGCTNLGNKWLFLPDAYPLGSPQRLFS
jgi:hypothetical protein